MTFDWLSKRTARAAGHPWVFFVAIVSVVIWAATGPLFRFSDTWQLVINTSTTVVTFLMVFLVQNMQNRDSKSMQLKLNEIIRTLNGAHNALLDMEELREEELDAILRGYKQLAMSARNNLRKGLLDTKRAELPISITAFAPAKE